MTPQPATASSDRSVQPGTVVCDADGNELGVVKGFTETGFEVCVPDSDAAEDGSAAADGTDTDLGRPAEHQPGDGVGEGYIVWRCEECGAVGDLAGGLPPTCPDCGAPRTALYRAQED